MISLSHSGKLVEKFIVDNSPTILAGVGIVGSAATLYFAGKGSFKAAEVLSEERQRRYMQNEPDMTFTDKAKITWLNYAPAVGTTALTIGCIVCANRISTGRAAALAAAYSVSNREFKEYKDKVTQKLGITKEQAIVDQVAQDRVNQNQPTGSVLITGDGNVLCMDSISGRYFRSTMEEIKRAQNDTNYEILHNNYCSLGDFYNRIGLAGTKFSEEVGWNSDHLLEITFSTVLTDDNQPCLVLDYSMSPTRGYDCLSA